MVTMSVKVPQEIVIKASLKASEIQCLRREIIFELSENNKWHYRFMCHGYGNGYGAMCPCKEDCDLRITDLNKCVDRVLPTGYSYKVQGDFFSSVSPQKHT